MDFTHGAGMDDYQCGREVWCGGEGEGVEDLDGAAGEGEWFLERPVVVVHPGAMREVHWHPTSDEWSFFLQGAGRITVFKAPESSTSKYTTPLPKKPSHSPPAPSSSDSPAQ